MGMIKSKYVAEEVQSKPSTLNTQIQPSTLNMIKSKYVAEEVQSKP
jgi:hypothetical protein